MSSCININIQCSKIYIPMICNNKQNKNCMEPNKTIIYNINRGDSSRLLHNCVRNRFVWIRFSFQLRRSHFSIKRDSNLSSCKRDEMKICIFCLLRE